MRAVPVVDVAALFEPGGDRAAVAAELHRAGSEYGFLSIVNHGLDPVLRRDAFAQAARFFALPLEEKRRSTMDTEGLFANRGYDGLGSRQLDERTLPDLMESFMLGVDLAPDDPLVVAGTPMHGPNRWPELDGFRPAIDAYHDAVQHIARTMLEGFALALGLDEGFFRPFHRQPIASLRLLHYPPRPAGTPGEQLGIGAHTDWGALTVLTQDGVGGLQVLDRDGRWLDVRPAEDALVINLGDLMEVWTNGRYRSTLHRVVGDPTRDRYSIALFFDLDWHGRIEVLPTCIDADHPARYGTTTVGEHLLRKFTASVVY